MLTRCLLPACRQMLDLMYAYRYSGLRAGKNHFVERHSECNKQSLTLAVSMNVY